jgi:hypothetical protein
LTDLGTKLVLE